MRRMHHRNNSVDMAAVAVIGIAVGLTALFLLRRNRSVGHALHAAGRDLRRAGSAASRNMAHQMRRGMKRGQEMVGDMEIGDHLRDYLESAKETVEDTVAREMRDLKRAIRRRRRRMGL